MVELLFPTHGPATVGSREDRRVVAEFTHQDMFSDEEETFQIHLVEQNDRWWISGYTLERHPHFGKEDMEPMVEFMKGTEQINRNL